jgi:hypothetical protein|tara:strand:+ start:382 stop:762 length:381 start_codon:yes stop_codon:yes gene_type:complete
MLIPQFFRDQTKKIRGNNFKEKIDTVANRCKKVYKDCYAAIDEGRDTTLYRQDFGNEHRVCYDLISSIRTPEDVEVIIDILATVLEESKSVGQKEALRYIITELQVATETSGQQQSENSRDQSVRS